MSRRRARAAPGGGDLRRPGAAAAGDEPRSLGPALRVSALVAAGCVVAALTFRIFDTDVWQHLAVGRAIWERQAIPMRDLWRWPTYGEPHVLPSWGFRALLWPFWQAADLTGLYLWRWLATLAAFVLLWLTARRLGARGFAVLPVLVVAALIYRQRSLVRPETLVAVLLAAQLWVLETRRAGGPDRSPWLIAIAWLWANVHISYYVGLVVLAVYALDAAAAPLRRGRPASPALGLWPVLAAAAAISFVNPFGARALAQPFEFLLARNEPMYRSIGELQPLDWRLNDRNGLPAFLILWPLLQLARARRGGFDRVEGALFLLFTPLALTSQRFTGAWVLLAAPFMARDVSGWISSRRWPAWTAGPWARAGLASAACVLLTGIELTRRDFVPGLGLLEVTVPRAACDFVARHGIRGRAFNHFELGGYLLWRFWPDRERLPFATIHPEALGREGRLAYFRAQVDANGWAELDARHPFEWVMLRRLHSPGDRLLDFLDADPRFALVFMDDAAAVYVRRGGRLAAVADSFALEVPRAGEAWLASLGARLARDPSLAARYEAELRRLAAASPLSASVENLWANLMLTTGRTLEAREHLERARAVNPHLPDYHLRRGLVALAAEAPREALREFHAERRVRETAWLDLRIGAIHRRLGQHDQARRWYARALERDPGSQAARDSLAALEALRR